MLVLIDLYLGADRDNFKLLGEAFFLNFVVLQIQAVTDLAQLLLQVLIEANITALLSQAKSRLDFSVDVDVSDTKSAESFVVDQGH